MRDRSNAGSPDDDFGRSPEVFAPRTPEQELERYKRAHRAAMAQVEPLLRGIKLGLRYVEAGDLFRAKVALETARDEAVKAALGS
jgi:hypothetical protein